MEGDILGMGNEKKKEKEKDKRISVNFYEFIKSYVQKCLGTQD